MELPDDQIILEENIDEDYEPTYEEIYDYAKWLGMDPDNEQDLLWIAEQSLKAPLPEPWKPCKTPTGELYYFNFASGESLWEHPCDEMYKQLYRDEKVKKELQKSSLPSQKQSNKPLSPELSSLTTNLKPVNEGQQVWKPNEASDDELNFGKPRLSRDHQYEERQAYERRLAMEFDNEKREMEQRHKARLRSLQEEMEEQQKSNQRRLQEAADAVIVEYRKQLQVREEREKEEMMLLSRRRLTSYEEELKTREHAQRTSLEGALSASMEKLRRQLQELEAEERKKVNAMKERLLSMSQSEKDEFQAQAVEAARKEARDWVEQQRDNMRSEALKKLEQEIEHEMDDERTRRMFDVVRDIHDEEDDQALVLHKELAELEAKISMRRQQLVEVEDSLAEKRASAVTYEAQNQAAEQTVPMKEAAVKRLAQELEGIQAQTAKARKEEEEAAANARRAAQQLKEAEGSLAQMRLKISDTESEMMRIERELAALKHRQKEQQDVLVGPGNVVDLEVTAALSAEAGKQLTARQAELVDIEQKIVERQEDLDEITNELVGKRTQALTSQLALADEVRQKAAEEFEAIERKLSEAREVLGRVNAEIAAKGKELRDAQVQLDDVRIALQSSRNALSLAAPELTATTADLKEKKEQLAEARLRLDEVGRQLLERQRDLASYEDQRRGLSREEEALLEVQRGLMQRSVAEKVDGEQSAVLLRHRAQMMADIEAQVRQEYDVVLANKRASMLREVEALAEEERTKLRAEQHQHLQQQRQQHEQPQTIPRSTRHSHKDLQRSNPAVSIPDSNSVHDQDSSEKSSFGIGSPLPIISPRMPAAPRTLRPRPLTARRSHTHQNKEGSRKHMPRLPEAIVEDRDESSSLDQLAGTSTSSILHKARTFLQQQRHYIRERQAAVEAARTEWLSSMSLVEAEADPLVRHEQSSLLRQVKSALEDQVRRLNQDTQQLKALKQHVKALEAGGAGTRLPADNVTLAFQSIRRRSLRASLEAISTALGEAIRATAARPSTLMGGGGLGPRPRGRSLSLGRGAKVDALLASSALATAAARARHVSAESTRGRRSRDQRRDLPITIMEDEKLAEAGLGFLTKWRNDGEMAEALLTQHGAWLRSFREQVSRLQASKPRPSTKLGTTSSVHPKAAPHALSASLPTGVVHSAAQAYLIGQRLTGSMAGPLASFGPPKRLGGLPGSRSAPLSGIEEMMVVDIGDEREMVIQMRRK